jgi:hypothetical protein
MEGLVGLIGIMGITLVVAGITAVGITLVGVGITAVGITRVVADGIMVVGIIPEEAGITTITAVVDSMAREVAVIGTETITAAGITTAAVAGEMTTMIPATRIVIVGIRVYAILPATHHIMVQGMAGIITVEEDNLDSKDSPTVTIPAIKTAITLIEVYAV